MPTQTANLDALIPREDFAFGSIESGGSPRANMALSDLTEEGFFADNLRKPDFQRETTHWSPVKIVDLVKAFLNGDLIPAVILWERGNEVFAIDGAHRLSALLAWIRNDYGDGTASVAMFGSGLTDEQRKIADRTRRLMRKEVGSYAEFKGLRSNKEGASEEQLRWLSRIGINSLVIQWVTANEPAQAEASFFKINQAAQPIDPTERRILQSRNSPNAIGARCAVRGGKGHKYWSEFHNDVQEEIERLGEEIYNALYEPPHQEPIATTDMPIAGKGYNALPFIFDLVNLSNGLPLPTTQTAKKIEKPLEKDADGAQTLKFLRNVWSNISLVSTNDSGSLGFHPLIYYYAMSGTFLPNAFLASIQFAQRLDQRNQKNEFTKVRRRFEDYVFKNKIFISLTVTKLGSGARSMGRLRDLYWEVFLGFKAGETDDELTGRLFDTPEFAHLMQSRVPAPRADEKPSKARASKSARSAAFIRDGMSSVLRCSICEGALHTNSITFDHTLRASEGGTNFSENLRPTHPYCNSGYKS